MKQKKSKRFRHYLSGELDTYRLAFRVIMQAVADVEDETLDMLERVKALHWLQGHSEQDKEDLDLWTSIIGINSEMIQKKYLSYRFLGNQLIVPTL